MKKPKPRFRVGQVVRASSGYEEIYRIDRGLDAGAHGQPRKVRAYWHYYFMDGGCDAECNMRPLNALEIGPGWKREKGKP